MSTQNKIRLNENSPSPREMADLLRACNIFLSPLQLEQLWSYHQLLRSHNTELNLTRIHNFKNMVLKLYADSIIPGQLLELASPLLDLGSGPGMPGIPLKIAYPHLDVYLAESRRKRVAFLEKACELLGLDHLHVSGGIVTASFEQPVGAVISRAVENIADTLDRIRGCLIQGGTAVFMKGPHCDVEIEDALRRFSDSYKLLQDIAYHIPGTPHQRRLVVLQRTDQPLFAAKVEAMKRFSTKPIESEQNEVFKNLKKLLSSRGIKKQTKALLSGSRIVNETLRDFPGMCEAWITNGDRMPPPTEGPDHLAWYQLNSRLYEILDVFGTRSPLLLARIPPLTNWEPSAGFPEGCSVLVPFQDPENVGALIRSSVAFGASQVILLAESAHPYHPKSIRASGGAVLRIELRQGPALKDLPAELPLVPLSADGKNIAEFQFPTAFGLLPGLEGPGIPEKLREIAISIPIQPSVESLNAATAAAIALYLWSQSST